ncbi:DUF5658 family protein [Stygiolobus caldivivus]|uniref:DUF5658 domain-containing protein n=1 Tax=Stygiolobus caldivivus TaxID=2824673 RepID=A0A8D5ZIQ2_9CREN|nr:DUF5658 family protein [Stygiolobus caldivivus]BCU69600.1 hypothetical protein KN1_08970 [Stygiolobus caldivivus]
MNRNYIFSITFMSLTSSALLDVITTFIGLEHGLTEANPFLSSLPPYLFFPVMIILKITIIGLSLILLRRGRIIEVLILSSMMIFVVLNNLFLILLH